MLEQLIECATTNVEHLLVEGPARLVQEKLAIFIQAELLKVLGFGGLIQTCLKSFLQMRSIDCGPVRAFQLQVALDGPCELTLELLVTWGDFPDRFVQPIGINLPI